MNQQPKTGIWLVGAMGGVASTIILGLIALQKKITTNAGLVSELPNFQGLSFTSWENIAIGGHEIRDLDLYEEVMRLHEVSRVFSLPLIESCKEDLIAIENNICSGTVHRTGQTITGLASENVRQRKESPREVIQRLQADISSFKERLGLDHIVVLNVASTEPMGDETGSLPSSWEELDLLLDNAADCTLPASSLYAIAALDQGYSYVNFTPSIGSNLPAIIELAEKRGAVHVGRDGKTGETLMKSVLAPMFAARNLNVMSWVGHNIFGNMDGKVLDDPINKQTKVTSKDKLLSEILGYTPQSLVSIEYIESLGDWKTAWDHIHFKGFLDTPMTLQFTWQGCDSLLAAPLALDLVRFADLAHRKGNVGVLSFLSSFFKSPMGTTEQEFAKQYQMLNDWAATVRD